MTSSRRYLALVVRRGSAVAVAAGLFFAGALLWAQSADVTYVQGGVDLQPSGQPRTEAVIGDTMRPGDSIITSSDGLAQLEKQNLAQLTISPGTVFTLRQLSENGKKRDVLAVSLGSLAFKFNELGGTEPLISTMSATAGIRGTVLKVFAGADGSSLFVVESGKVTVSGASGKSVDLTQNEGVEVNPGGPPGEKFKVLYGTADFSAWNRERIDRILSDPSGVATSVERQMDTFVAEIRRLSVEYGKAHSELEAARSKYSDIKAKEGDAGLKKYYNTIVYPLEARAAALYINLRYYTVSAVSLRRFVLARMYVRLTTMYILKLDEPYYQSFYRVYQRVIAAYNRYVVPQLVEADI